MADENVNTPDDAKATVEKHVAATTTPDPMAQIKSALAEAIAPSVAAIQAVADMQKSMEERLTALELNCQPEALPEPAAATTASKLIAAASDDSEPSKPRIKKPIEHYDQTKTAFHFPSIDRHGNKQFRAGDQLDESDGYVHNRPSQADKAVCGAYLKLVLNRGDRTKLNEHENQLLDWQKNEGLWTGFEVQDNGRVRDTRAERAPERFRKATVLINDTTSGGQYAVPTPLDDLLIQEPVLNGELFPLVTLRNATAASVQGFTVGHPTITSNHTEGSAFTLLTTDGLISNLDTTIFPAVCGVQYGLDLASDTVLNITSVLQNSISAKFAEWLDNQIANGDGTTEPEGIFTKSGTTTVSSSGGTSGPYVTADFENQIFGVSLARRRRSNRCVFVMADRQYNYARQIVTATNYQTRALGMDHQSYMILEYPVKIQESVAYGTTGFCDFVDYVMYRRLGAQFRVSTEGATLIKANSGLITFRARFGGQLALAAACCKMTDGDQSQA